MSFPGFELVDVPVGATTIHAAVGGSGPPVLLLHGIPETHRMWHRVAPILAGEFTVVAADLRGFGASGSPPSAPDHSPYSMRSLALDQLELMGTLGHPRFSVAGHDRGGRCAYRLALDHPDAVLALAVLDVVPTAEAFARADADFAFGFWVWSFLAAEEPTPERLVSAAPDAFVDAMLNEWADSDVFPPELRAAYVAQFREPHRVHAICEQYRAAATLDRAHDEADRGAPRMRSPVPALWSATGAVAAWYDPVAVWREWADDVRGRAVNCGHFLPEEAPDETATELAAFFRASADAD